MTQAMEGAQEDKDNVAEGPAPYAVCHIPYTLRHKRITMLTYANMFMRGLTGRRPVIPAYTTRRRKLSESTWKCAAILRAILRASTVFQRLSQLFLGGTSNRYHSAASARR